jgi:hypothetical protein
LSLFAAVNGWVLEDVKDLTPEVYDTARDNALSMLRPGAVTETPPDKTEQIEENVRRLKMQFPERKSFDFAEIMSGVSNG